MKKFGWGGDLTKINILKKILFSSCILISCVLFCCCDNSPKQTDTGTNASETPHPRLIQREVREDHDIDIDGRHYEWIRYCKEGVGLRIIGLRTKEDTLVIPSQYLGYSVTQLGGTVKQVDSNITDSYYPYSTDKMNGFMEETHVWNADKEQRLKKIIVSEGIKKISNAGFSFVKADEIILPQSLSNIDGFSFYNSLIDKVTVKNPELKIGWNAFSFSSLKEISFPEHFKGQIQYGCFDYSSIEKFNWPEGGLVSSVFKNCKNLKQIIFPENQEKIIIPAREFYECPSLKKLEFPASTGTVVMEENYYADNFKEGGVETLVFLGKNTKIKWIATSIEQRVIPNFITAGKIIAPKGSAAIDFAKKAKKFEYFSPILIRDILSDDIISVTDYTDTDVRRVPVKYSYL